MTYEVQLDPRGSPLATLPLPSPFYCSAFRLLLLFLRLLYSVFQGAVELFKIVNEFSKNPNDLYSKD